jgi:hypothetical protein
MMAYFANVARAANKMSLANSTDNAQRVAHGGGHYPLHVCRLLSRALKVTTGGR